MQGAPLFEGAPGCPFDAAHEPRTDECFTIEQALTLAQCRFALGIEPEVTRARTTKAASRFLGGGRRRRSSRCLSTTR